MNLSRFSQRLQLRFPLVQAPMAGGATTPELVAAVSNAGGLGSLAAGMLSPAAITTAVTAIRRASTQPFVVNLFVQGTPVPDPAMLADAIEHLQPFYRELGVEPPESGHWCENFSDQLECVLALQPPVLSFTFGLLDAATVARCQAAGCLVIGTATTVAEARAWQAVGADAICAQGAEAGGHRGSFLPGAQLAMIGTLALVPQVVDAVDIPVIAAGGVMDGRGVAACLLLGATAVQLGTAFLSCPEAGIDRVYRQCLAQARDDSTRVTRVFSGRAARGLDNSFIQRMAPYESQVPDYPLQNALTGPIRKAAARSGQSGYLSLWAGQGVGMSRVLPAAELLLSLDQEWRAALRHASEVVAGGGTAGSV